MNLDIVKNQIKVQGLIQWMAFHNGHIVGYIFMQPEPEEKRIKFLDAWVHENYRRQGVYRKLWETRWEFVAGEAKYKDWTVYAWCKSGSLPLLLEKGFSAGEMVTYVEKTI